jgi:outer membrane protein assembly factor BamA
VREFLYRYGVRARAGRWAIFAAFVLCALFAEGCKKRRDTEPPGPRVRRVELEGVERFDDAELHGYLELQPKRPFSFGAAHHYLPGLEDVDASRIEDVYRAHGHYDARVEDAQVKVIRSDKPVRRQRVDLRYTVVEGPPTLVREIEFEWIGQVATDAERREVEASSNLAPGGPFGIPDLAASARTLELELRKRGFAKASVEKDAWVDTEMRLADVRFRLEPGPRLAIDRIEIEGLDHVPEYLVQREIERVIGKSYSPEAVARVERSIYGLGVFSTVSVEDGDVLGPGRMSLKVRVIESKLQRIRVGVGLGVDPVRWEQRASMLYRHDNLFGHLTRFDLRVRAGYAELPALYDPQEHGPIAGVDVTMRKKGLLEKHLVWTASPGFELGIWEGYQFWSLRHRLGVSRFFTRFLELGLSYNNRFTSFFNISDVLDTNRTILGLDFRDPYFLAYVELIGTLHLTDDIVEPRNGVRFTTSYDIASTYLGGQFDYHRVEPDLRAYWRPHDRVQLAARGRVGFIFPYGRNPGVPIDLKLYLGGAGDVRGWPFRRLSPRIESCDMDGDCRQIPIGGKSMVHGTFELRVRTIADLWIAGFGDMGDVRDEIADLSGDGLMYSSGGGLRYVSPIGTFRLDVGVRINEDPRFPEPRRWALHFGLGEVF